jgi:RNA polymerase sigma-70 factor (ECF subfamily)
MPDRVTQGVHAIATRRPPRGGTGPSPQSAAPGARGLREELGAVLPSLRARALKLCLNHADAQDVVQDTVLRALRFEQSYQPGTNLRAWMQQILLSVFVSRCRRVGRERRALDRLTHDPCAWTRVDQQPCTQALSPAVEIAIDSLPRQYAAVVRLVDLQEHSYKDAATELRVPVGTVMSRLFRGRRLLASNLQPPPAARAA